MPGSSEPDLGSQIVSAGGGQVLPF
jgi:hypothetical protein